MFFEPLQKVFIYSLNQALKVAIVNQPREMVNQSEAAIVVTDIDRKSENHVLTLLREIGEEAIDGDRKNVVRLVNYYYSIVKKRAEIMSPLWRDAA